MRVNISDNSGSRFSLSVQQGFTLLEMSIVIVVVGFLIAGVMTGRALLSTARAQTVLNELNMYKSAYEMFRVQYDAVPGDMKDAREVFENTTTRNGNGNGIVDWTADCLSETGQVYYHMYLAKVLDRRYSLGVYWCDWAGDANGMSKLGEHVKYPIHMVGQFKYFYGRTGNAIFGMRDVGDGILTPKDAQFIDRKIDDGFASTGNVMGMTGGDVYASSPHLPSELCTDWNKTGSNLEWERRGLDYRLANTLEACVIWMMIENKGWATP